MAAPSNIVHSTADTGLLGRPPRRPPLLILDPRVPGQRPDSALGSVLGRPSAETALARHFAELMARRAVLPDVVQCGRVVPAHRRRPHLAGRRQLGRQTEPAAIRRPRDRRRRRCRPRRPRRSCTSADDRPLTAADLMSAKLPMPPRVALVACASGGDYQFDEATGLVAAMILGGAQLVTATLWSLRPRRDIASSPLPQAIVDPMAEVIIAVDHAHEAAGRGERGEPLATRADATMARRRHRRKPVVLGGAGHIRRRRRPMRRQVGGHADDHRGLVARPVVGVDDAARG